MRITFLIQYCIRNLPTKRRYRRNTENLLNFSFHTFDHIYFLVYGHNVLFDNKCGCGKLIHKTGSGHSPVLRYAASLALFEDNHLLGRHFVETFFSIPTLRPDLLLFLPAQSNPNLKQTIHIKIGVEYS